MKVKTLLNIFPVILILASCYMFYLQIHLAATAYVVLGLLTWLALAALNYTDHE
jgi:hypothetical protein